MTAPRGSLRNWSLALLAAVAAAGCGVIKGRGDRVVVVHDGPSAAQGASSSSEDESVRQIKQFLDLYTQNGGLTREGLANLLVRYKDKIAPFLGGVHMSPQDLSDLLFSFDSNHDGILTPEEISNGLADRIPILRWIPDNQASITRQELDQKLATTYPHASVSARAGLGDTLMRFDEAWVGGNADGKLSRTEVSAAGLILGVLGQTDFTHGVAVPPGVFGPSGQPSSGPGAIVGQLAPKIIQQKLDQQLFTRYNLHDANQLSADDLRLEWMQLALKFFLVDNLIHKFAPDGKLPLEQSQRALSVWGIAQLGHWAPLRKLYDNAAMGGDGDGKFNTLEAFNYLGDLEFACKVRALMHDQYSAVALTANPSRQYLFGSLMKVFPRTGQALFMTSDRAAYNRDNWAVNAAYWDGFGQWDTERLGGDHDGSIDEGEVAMAFVYARLVENLYEVFDTNHDTFLTQDEAKPLFAIFDITNSRVIDAFFADVALDTSDPSVWTRIRAFFTGDGGVESLRPYDFHIRLVKIMPRMLNGEHL